MDTYQIMPVGIWGMKPVEFYNMFGLRFPDIKFHIRFIFVTDWSIIIYLVHPSVDAIQYVIRIECVNFNSQQDTLWIMLIWDILEYPNALHMCELVIRKVVTFLSINSIDQMGKVLLLAVTIKSSWKKNRVQTIFFNDRLKNAIASICIHVYSNSTHAHRFPCRYKRSSARM